MSNGSRPSTRPSTHSWAQGLDRLLLPLQRRLADAREARVGAQADEQVVPQSGVGQEGLEAYEILMLWPASAGSACRGTEHMQTASARFDRTTRP